VGCGTIRGFIYQLYILAPDKTNSCLLISKSRVCLFLFGTTATTSDTTPTLFFMPVFFHLGALIQFVCLWTSSATMSSSISLVCPTVGDDGLSMRSQDSVNSPSAESVWGE
jgi:hypothetical protein